MLDLQERLYTSTEVAEILGVSLRSVYRYLEEGKLNAEVKTATGRHRFTKKNILDFLYPDGNIPAQVSTQAPKETQKTVSQPASFQRQAPTFADEPTSMPIRPQYQTAGNNFAAPSTPPAPSPKLVIEETPEPESVEEEPIDWLAKFREAAKKFREEEEVKEKATVRPTPAPTPAPMPAPEPEELPRYQQVKPQPRPQEPRAEEPKYYKEPAFVQDEEITGLRSSYKQEKEPEQGNMHFYKSGLGGLKDIAQNIDKTARNSDLDYAFTLNAGLSLFKPIKPFSILHAYIRPEDKDFFEKMLKLSPSSEESAQLCLITSRGSSVFNNRTEMHGLYVVSKDQLSKDIKQHGDNSLADESRDILS